MTNLKDLQLYKENNKYYLSAVIESENMQCSYEVSIPRIELPISSCCAMSDNVDNYFGHPHHTVVVDLGFGELYAEPFNDENCFYTITCLEEKIHEMTLAEIEKKLGYKIKLKEN